MSANEFVDYISEYQNTGKVNDVIKRITGTEVINENKFNININNNLINIIYRNIKNIFLTIHFLLFSLTIIYSLRSSSS